jgi:hypothetical protein
MKYQIRKYGPKNEDKWFMQCCEFGGIWHSYRPPGWLMSDDPLQGTKAEMEKALEKLNKTSLAGLKR